MWPAAGSRVKICCLDTTLYDLPTVFDDEVIRAGRAHPLRAIGDGVLTHDRDLVTWEKLAFERLFDAAFRGNAEEQTHLRALLDAKRSTSPFWAAGSPPSDDPKG